MHETTLKLAAVALLLTACAKEKQTAATDTTAAPAAAVADTTKGMEADADQSHTGSGVPTGYVALTDGADKNITDAKYTVAGGRWEVQTGPAHIIYASKDSASGVYAASASFQQLEKPRHPEAYGIIFGGQHLDDRAAQRYGYFLVRGTGEYLIKARDGDHTTTVVDWKASPDVPKQDASGKAAYDLKVHVAPDTVHFFVNGKLVNAVPKSKLSTDGIAGLRINHNLHVSVTPVTVAK
ncbi:MAG TPA: hypothetical protein VFS05_00240 [Gemmatimonadaceae bacterium]|nr:hypothetical protein [Gemmatimonadaceae bacterium]